MARKKLERPELKIDPSDPNYIDALVDACIQVFPYFLNTALTLDYMGVEGKSRSLVLEHVKFKKASKQKIAESVAQELADIQSLEDEIEEDSPNADNYDIRGNEEEAKAFVKDTKETIANKLKVKQLKKEILAEHASDDDASKDAMNIFFIPLTAAEFAAMRNIEIKEGDDDVGFKGEDDKKDQPVASAGVEEKEDADQFIVDSEGNMEDLPEPLESELPKTANSGDKAPVGV